MLSVSSIPPFAHHWQFPMQLAGSCNYRKYRCGPSPPPPCRRPRPIRAPSLATPNLSRRHVHGRDNPPNVQHHQLTTLRPIHPTTSPKPPNPNTHTLQSPCLPHSSCAAPPSVPVPSAPPPLALSLASPSSATSQTPPSLCLPAPAVRSSATLSPATLVPATTVRLAGSASPASLRVPRGTTSSVCPRGTSCPNNGLLLLSCYVKRMTEALLNLDDQLIRLTQ